jgi:hypothetical protein
VSSYEDDMDSNLEYEDFYGKGTRGTLKKVDAPNILSLADIQGETVIQLIFNNVKQFVVQNFCMYTKP